MTDQEKINENLQRQIDAQNARIDNVLTKVEMLVEESRQQREDIRRAQEKHDADMRELQKRQEAAQEKHDADMRELQKRQEAAQAKHDADMKAAQAKHDADMKEIRSEIRDALRNIQGLTIASMVGITAIAVGVLGFLWSTARNMEPPQNPPAQTTQYQSPEATSK